MIRELLIELNINESIADIVVVSVYLCITLILSLLANYAAKKIIVAAIHKFVKKSRNDWDDALLNRHVFNRFSHIAPVIIIYSLAPVFFVGFDRITLLLKKGSYIYLVLVGLLILDALLNAIVDIYRKFEVSRKLPIRGFCQVIKIILSIVAGVAILSICIDKKIWPLLTGMGAFTAVLMLVFKDSILGLVAGIQLTSNNMVHIGDWIEMPKFGADGDVIDITLTTVKIQNFDKTISTVPAYALISDSFKNWRGMAESRGRRIKRSVNIDTGSIKFCDDKMIEKFKKYQFIENYIESKEKEITEWNKEKNVDDTQLVNGRRMTNVGVLRAYITEYLRHNVNLNKDMTMMVRQLEPTSQGLPLQIYTFCSDKRWVYYEGVQADIFDHILAVIPEFELKVYQQPAGSDICGIIKNTN